MVSQVNGSNVLIDSVQSTHKSIRIEEPKLKPDLKQDRGGPSGANPIKLFTP